MFKYVKMLRDVSSCKKEQSPKISLFFDVEQYLVPTCCVIGGILPLSKTQFQGNV